MELLNLVSGSSMNFNNVIFTSPTTINPYQKLLEIFVILQCGNVKSTNSNVCSGHNNCLSLDECTCFDKYYSSHCLMRYYTDNLQDRNEILHQILKNRNERVRYLLEFAIEQRNLLTTEQSQQPRNSVNSSSSREA